MAKGRYVILNGELKDSSTPFLTDNRAFRFGDGVFESIRIMNGMPYNLNSHVNRMLDGAKAIGIEIPPHFGLGYFEGQIKNLINKNSILAGGKVRLSLFRSGEGTYLPESNEASFFIECFHLNQNFFELNEEGKLVEVFSEVTKCTNALSKYKTSNSLLYILAAKYAQDNEVDDALLINTMGKVVEATSSNLFLVSNGVLYTPPLDDGCVGGTMRMNVINCALENKITVYESSLSPQNLLIADEVFLTNAIQGIQWVGGYKSKRYYNKTAKLLLKKINEKEANLKLDLQGS